MSQIFEEFQDRKAEILDGELEPKARIEALGELAQEREAAIKELSDEELEEALRAIREQEEGLYIVRDGVQLDIIEPEDIPVQWSLRMNASDIELEKLRRQRPAA